jgi:hypothetical protein
MQSVDVDTVADHYLSPPRRTRFWTGRGNIVKRDKKNDVPDER